MAPDEVRESLLLILISVVVTVRVPPAEKASLAPFMVILLPLTVIDVPEKLAESLRVNAVLVIVVPLLLSDLLPWIVSLVIVTLMKPVAALTATALLEMVVLPEP